MCGITGTIGKNDDGKTALLMAQKIKHRGPDEEPTVITTGNASLCAVRLSIVDVHNGTQPMTDGTGNIVAQNGEIYNHEELRIDLAHRGYVFKTNCDTEVLLAGFSIYGPKFVAKLDGIFAISFYDAQRKKLYLFRDYFGVKPLYYLNDTEGFEYSSEIKSFWRDDRNFDIDLDFIIYNFVFNWSNPKATLYQGIIPVLPSTYIELDQARNITQHGYIPDNTAQPARNFLEATKQTSKNLEYAVKSQIPNEVEWGTLLSGGVDSSILAWQSKRLNPNLKTFSVGSEELDSEDLVNARMIAGFLGTDHTEIRIDAKEAIDNYADYLYTIEDINSRFYFYYFIAKFLSGKVKVALCGEGADELYMGYPVYRDLDDFIKAASDRWAKVGDIAGPIKDEVEDMFSLLRTKKESGIYELMLKTQLPWFQLNPVDKCSMRFGVEFRVPYLSLVHALPAMRYQIEDQLSGSIEKNILRTAFKGSKLPTLDRKKYFAGTRTLPSFYAELDTLAEHEYPRLQMLYPKEAKILHIKDLYSLSLLDARMRGNTNNTAEMRRM